MILVVSQVVLPLETGLLVPYCRGVYRLLAQRGQRVPTFRTWLARSLGSAFSYVERGNPFHESRNMKLPIPLSGVGSKHFISADNRSSTSASGISLSMHRSRCKRTVVGIPSVRRLAVWGRDFHNLESKIERWLHTQHKHASRVTG